MKIQSMHYCLMFSVSKDQMLLEEKTKKKNLTVFAIFFKGSRFYENELKKDQQVNQRIEKMMRLKEKITQQQLLKAQLQVLIL